MAVKLLALTALVFVGAATANGKAERKPTANVLDYELVNTYPHRRDAFTQGLVFDGGVLWEGTGQHGRSSVAKIRLQDGAVLASRHLPTRYFGEGITVLNGRVLQLTWKAGLLFTYDATSLKPLSSIAYQGEGWGLTHNKEQLIVSDGSAHLQFRSMEDFSVQRRLEVRDNAAAVANLNELEWVDGLVLANIWQSDWIVAINPADGAVVARLDLSALRRQQHRRAGVLNGIAWRADQQTLLVTGKYWHSVYEIRPSPDLPYPGAGSSNSKPAP